MSGILYCDTQDGDGGLAFFRMQHSPFVPWEEDTDPNPPSWIFWKMSF